MVILNHEGLHLMSPIPEFDMNNVNLVEMDKISDKLVVSIKDGTKTYDEWCLEFNKCFKDSVNKVGNNIVEIRHFSQFYLSSIL